MGFVFLFHVIKRTSIKIRVFQFPHVCLWVCDSTHVCNSRKIAQGKMKNRKASHFNVASVCAKWVNVKAGAKKRMKAIKMLMTMAIKFDKDFSL